MVKVASDIVGLGIEIVNADEDYQLSDQQLRTLGSAFQRGAAEASAALEKWIERPSLISVDAVQQLALPDATSVLGDGDEPICFCSAECRGRLAGEIILAFDDCSGLALADMLLNQPRGTASEWDELARSAALETTNIIGCAYLNALTRALPPDPHGKSELIPAPPQFRRDYANSLMQFALMAQVAVANHVFLAKSLFHVDGSPVNWTLLLVPDAESIRNLRRLLPGGLIPDDDQSAHNP